MKVQKNEQVVHFVISKHLHKFLKDIARTNNRTLAGQIRFVLEAHAEAQLSHPNK